MRRTDGDAAPDFGSVLKGLRIAGGLTQDQLGRMLAVRRDPEDQHPRPVKGGTVSGWERGSPMGDFKGETRASTIAQFEQVEAEMVRRARKAGRALPEWYSEGDLVRAVVSVIDSRGTQPVPLRPNQEADRPGVPGDGAPGPEPANGRNEPPPWVRSVRRRRLQIAVPVALALVVGAVFAIARSGQDPTPPAKEGLAPTASTLPAFYRDDFSDPLSGWGDGGTDAASSRYVAGRYQLLLAMPNRGRFEDSPLTELPPRLRLEVEATKVVPVLGSFGLACRDNGGLRYEGRIDVNQSWRIARGTTVLAEGVHDVIKSDGANLLALECRGGSEGGAPVELDLYVNGALVGRAPDPVGLAPGKVGVVLASQLQEVQVLFDNFAIRPL